jgi:glycerol-3-phosphate acyltransferase PlsY
MELAIACVLAFLLGSVPWALVVVKWIRNVDLRTIGSGNVGATNASRAFENKASRIGAFLGIYVLDAGKGFAPALLAQHLDVTPRALAGVLCGACAVLGHVFTPWLGFRGGKGVATATGALLALDWQATVAALLVFFVVRLSTGQVFFGSLALGAALPVAAVALHLETAFHERLPVTIFCAVIAGLLFWTHRGNLKKHFAARIEGNA